LEIDISKNDSGNNNRKTIIDIIPALSDIQNNYRLSSMKDIVAQCDKTYKNLYEKAVRVVMSYADIDTTKNEYGYDPKLSISENIENSNVENQMVKKISNRNYINQMLPNVDLYSKKSELMFLTENDRENLIDLIKNQGHGYKFDDKTNINLYNDIANLCNKNNKCKNLKFNKSLNIIKTNIGNDKYVYSLLVNEKKQ